MLILWAYFMVPILIGTNVPGFVTMLVTLVLYEGAFLSEVVRGGIVALGRGQMEAARALGHSYLGAMRYVILPQALYNVLPSILSQFVSTIKETTLGYVINVPELTFAANQINNQLLTKPFQVFAILALVYYMVCWTLTRAALLARAPHRPQACRLPGGVLPVALQPQCLRPSHDPAQPEPRSSAHDQVLERQQVLWDVQGAR